MAKKENENRNNHENGNVDGEINKNDKREVEAHENDTYKVMNAKKINKKGNFIVKQLRT